MNCSPMAVKIRTPPYLQVNNHFFSYVMWFDMCSDQIRGRQFFSGPHSESPILNYLGDSLSSVKYSTLPTEISNPQPNSPQR